MSEDDIDFDIPRSQEGLFVVDIKGFEGPLDLLLSLARTQKMDITKISILALAEQYIAFIDKAREMQLDIAAQYLVMAAWLAYLKSRLLLPQKQEEEEELSAKTHAEILAWRLVRLQAMREVGQKLMDRERLGVDILTYGKPEGIKLINAPLWQDRLYDLLRAYGRQRDRKKPSQNYKVERPSFITIDEAYKILSKRLGISSQWELLERFLPLVPYALRRSSLASSFSAMLILAKDGLVEVRQEQSFAPLYLRSLSPPQQSPPPSSPPPQSSSSASLDEGNNHRKD